MCRVRCEVTEGLNPSEKIAKITTADGSVENVEVSGTLIQPLNGGHGVVVHKIGTDGNGNVLVELPRESATGKWRIWVSADALVEGVTVEV